MAFVILNVIFQFLVFIPAGLTQLLNFMKIIALAGLAAPTLQLPANLFNFLENQASSVSNIRESVVNFVVGKVGGKEKKTK